MKKIYSFIFLFMIFSVLFPTESISQKNKHKRDSSTRPTLRAGDILAQLPLQRRKKRYTRGSFAFTEIKVFNRGRKKYAQGELIFEAEGGVINSIVNLEDGTEYLGSFLGRRRSHKVRIKGLSRTKPQVFWVEVQLAKPGDEDDPNSLERSRLKISLRSRDWTRDEWYSDSRYIEWKIANCGSSYHRALTSFGGKSIANMRQGLRQINAADKSLPGRWYFGPIKRYRTVTEVKNICMRHKLKRDPNTGKFYKSCQASKKVKRTRRKLIKGPENEQKLLAAAKPIVFSKGYDRYMQRSSGNFLFTRKIYLDLQRYMTQRANPSICTGTIEMVEFYENKFDPHKLRGENMKLFYEEASRRALDKGKAYLDLISSRIRPQVVKTRAWGLLSGNSQEKRPKLGLQPVRQQLEKLVNLHTDTVFRESFKKAETLPAKLAVFKENFTAYKDALGLTEEESETLYNTLTMTEAAYYLHKVSARYENLVSAFSGSLMSIRTLHGRYCLCSG